NFQVLAQRGDVRFPAGTVQPLGHVEDDVRMREREFLREEFVGFETDDGTEETESLVDRIDGGWVVPFGIGVGRGTRVRLLVVCETYSHVKSEYETKEGCAREKRKKIRRRSYVVRLHLVVGDARGFLFVVGDVNLEIREQRACLPLEQPQHRDPHPPDLQFSALAATELQHRAPGARIAGNDDLHL